MANYKLNIANHCPRLGGIFPAQAHFSLTRTIAMCITVHSLVLSRYLLSIYSQLTLSLVLVSMFWCWPRARFHTVHLTRGTKYCCPHVVSNTRSHLNTAPSVFLCGLIVRLLVLAWSLVAPSTSLLSSTWSEPSLPSR